MQRFHPYYVVDRSLPLCHHFLIMYGDAPMQRMVWNDVELQTLTWSTTTKLPWFGDDIPNDLVPVVDAIKVQVGNTARVCYLGYFALHRVVKMILVQQHKNDARVTRALTYRVLIRILPDGACDTEGITRHAITPIKTVMAPTMVIPYYSTIDVAAVQHILETVDPDQKSPFFRSLYPLCGAVGPGVALALNTPSIPLIEFNNIHRLVPQVPLDRFRS